MSVSGGTTGARRRRTPLGRRWGITTVVALLATLGLLAAACSNDTGDTSTGSGASSGTSSGTASGEKVAVDAPGVTDTEIRVGGVASVTNPLGGNYGDAFKGVQAYFDKVNAEGGVYGRKLVLASQRDDKLANNKSEVQGLLAQDNVFAVLPVATLLFTGADLLVQENVPTFGWTINPEWEGSASNPKANLFGQSGSFLCFDCASPVIPWVAQEQGAHKIGLLAYSVPQSASCGDGVRNSVEKYGPDADAEIAFEDKSLSFGAADLSVQVSKMKDAGVDLVVTCMDTNGVVTLAKEMKKQQLDAVQYLPNGYDHTFVQEFGDLFEGSYVRTDFTQWEIDDKPSGLSDYLEWIDKQGAEPSENSMSAWLNADLFVQGLRAAGPNFTRQKVIDAINQMTDYKADGILQGVDWTTAHTQQSSDFCQFISKIHDSAFVPEYSQPGQPFVCVSEENGTLSSSNSD